MARTPASSPPRWDWKIDDEFVTGDRNRFAIVDLVDGEALGDDSEFAGVWAVRASSSSPHRDRLA